MKPLSAGPVTVTGTNGPAIRCKKNPFPRKLGRIVPRAVPTTGSPERRNPSRVAPKTKDV